MRIRSLLAPVLAFALATISAGCSSSDKSATPKIATVSCGAAAAPAACWQELRPLGSGGWPPGTANTPVFEAGKFPLGLKPRVTFNGDLWMIGQSYAYSSSDGITWKQRGNAAWPVRGAHAMAVFQDKLWLFGGANHIKEDRGTDAFLNDVWVSEDGVQWKQVTGAAPWSPRDNAGVEVLGDALYLVGGPNKADVWRSNDGKEWTELTDAAPWQPRADYGAHDSWGGDVWQMTGRVKKG